MGFWSRLFGRGGFEQHLSEGQRYQAAGELGLARAEYEAALKDTKGQAEERVDELRRLLSEVRARLGQSHLERAQRLVEGGFLDEAEDAYELALELLDSDSEREVGLAALRRLEEARRLPAEEEALEAEGEEFLAESVEQRFEIFLMAIEDPRVADAYRALGSEFAEAVLLLQEGRAAEASEALRHLLKDAPGRPPLHLELGRALLFLGDPESGQEAVEHIQRWRDVYPEDWSAASSLAEALRLAGQNDEATDLLMDIVEANPPESPALLRLAEHNLAIERWEEAVEAASEGLRHRPRSLELKRVLGLALHGAGHTAQATQLLEEVLQARWRVDPDTGEVEIDRSTAWALSRIHLADERAGEEQLERSHGLLRALEAEASEAELPLVLAAQARALDRLGRAEEASRCQHRAQALAETESQRRAVAELLP